MQASRTRRVSKLVAGVLVTLPLLAGAASAAPESVHTKKIDIDDACTIVSTKQLKKAFGGPVAAGVAEQGGGVCRFQIGDATKGGTFTAIRLYPNMFGSGGSSAPDSLVDLHAVDQLSGDSLKDVFKVGKSAYLNYTKREVDAALTKKYAITLNWTATPTPTRLSDKDAKKLVALAKAAVSRAPV